MGYDVTRFRGDINAQFKCSICTDVLRDPVQRSSCEHIFCRKCIETWLKQHKTCPQDREPLFETDLKKAPRILTLLMSELEISCEFKTLGCEEFFGLDALEGHVKDCPFNPNALVMCKNCGAFIIKKRVEGHSCLSYLKGKVKENEVIIEEVIKDNTAIKEKLKIKDELIKDLRVEISKLRLENELLSKKVPSLGLLEGHFLGIPAMSGSRFIWESEDIWSHSAPKAEWAIIQDDNRQSNRSVDTNIGGKRENVEDAVHEVMARDADDAVEEDGGEDGEEVTTIKINHLPKDVERGDVAKLFAQFGRIRRIFIGKSEYQTGSFSFVTFERREDALKALNRVKGQTYHNLNLAVEWAKKNLASKGQKWLSQSSLPTSQPDPSGWIQVKGSNRRSRAPRLDRQQRS